MTKPALKMMSTQPNAAPAFRERFLDAVSQLRESFVARDTAVRALAITTLLGENCLLVGDPGTAKTALIERWLTHVGDARLFSRLCGSFTTLDEIVGPLDIAAFQAGRFERVTSRMMPESTHAFLDEALKSNDGTINSLLGLLNERTFDGKLTELDAVYAATNWPEVKARSEKVGALYDRFVLRLHVLPCKGVDHTRMLEASERVECYVPRARFTVEEIRAARAEVKSVAICDAMRSKLTEVVERLASEGVVVSDRRSVRALRALRASAWLAGRTEVTIADFGDLEFVLWTDEADIDKLSAVLDTIDKQLVRSLVQSIDSTLEAVAQFDRLDYAEQSKRQAALLKQIADVRDEVVVKVRLGTVTERGLSQIRAPLAQLGESYKTLKAAIKQRLSLG